MKRLNFLLALCILAPNIITAQARLSVADFTTKPTFTENRVTGINWMKDGRYYSALFENRIIRYDVTTGQPMETIVDGGRLEPELIIEGYSFSADESMVLLQTQVKPIYRRSFRAEYYVYERATRQLRPLSSRGAQSYATFSPQGDKIAFVRNNNLFYVAVAGMVEHAVTNDGQFNSIINGTTDWVYEEEFSFVVGFEWSPDGSKLAYYKFDESEVKEYNLQYWSGLLYPYDYRYKYPKAGERNSSVQVWIHDLESGRKLPVETGENKDIYIPRIKWTADPRTLSIVKLNRLQNHMQLLHANGDDGSVSVVIDEKTDTYIDIEILDVRYLQNRKEFIRMSESEGFMQLYLHDITGKVLRKLATGMYDVTELVGVDESRRVAYYVSTEQSPLERHLYTISFDGRKKSKLTEGEGIHEINMSDDYQFYIDHHGSAKHPRIATLYQVRRNTAVKVLEKNEALVKKVDEYDLVEKEFFKFRNRSGVELHGFFLKPGDFDPARKYPVILYQYSGPGSQEVQNSWGADHFYFHQLLAQRGYIVAFVDPRGTGGRGVEFKKVTYKQLGKFELEDIIDAAGFLASQTFIDEERMGIWGWSYGGYMSSLALTRAAGTFKLGIAVSPVTNWRFYDTIYTERYLQTPQLNAAGYDLNSPLSYAEKLKGKFLLIHGTGDDNVHIQNSIAFQDALINAGVQFESFFYPDKHHGIQGGSTRHHLYTMMSEFIANNL